jgi:uncharacterized protein YdeI (BOF family)
MLHCPHAIVQKIIFALMLLSAPASIDSTATMAADLPQRKVVSIAEARRLPLETMVTIEGSVTVPSGTFRSSISDEGFAVQDRSGGGIYVGMKVDMNLRLGERVRVTGKLARSNEMLTLVPTAGAEGVRRRGRGPQVRPERIATGRVNETTEGRLVKVVGTVTRAIVADAPYGARLFLDDGTGEIQIYVSASAGIDLSSLRPGQQVSATGLSSRYKDHYEIDPRFPADIRASGR